MKHIAKRILWTILSYIPSPLPVGVQAFERFCNRIILVSGLPNNRSTKFAIATAVLHLGKTKRGYCQDWKPLRYFVKDLRKGASHEVVVNMMEGYKKAQKEEFEALNKAPVIEVVPNR